MIDIEALAAPAFLVEISAQGIPAGLRLNAAGRACPELACHLAETPAAAWVAKLANAHRGRAAEAMIEAPLAPSACDAGARWRASLVPVTGPGGRVASLLGICRAVKAGTGTEAWPQTGDHLSLTLQAIHGAEWRYDAMRGAYEGSDEIATLIGEAEPRHVTWTEWLERLHPQDLTSFIGRPEPEGTTEFRFHAVDGTLRWARCSRIPVVDEAGAVEAVLGIMVDITSERVRETAWAELAIHDPLTGLLNRRGLRQEFDRLQVDISSVPCLAVFAVDLDHFKGTNDAHGHAAGDAVLVEASRRLAAVVGDAACARLGGDEFVAVLSVSSETEAQDMRGRLQRAFQRPLAFRGHWLPVSASVGMACASGAIDVVRLMDGADADLYVQKRAPARARPIAA